jgi:hypothetical protein
MQHERSPRWCHFVGGSLDCLLRRVPYHDIPRVLTEVGGRRVAPVALPDLDGDPEVESWVGEVEMLHSWRWSGSDVINSAIRHIVERVTITDGQVTGIELRPEARPFYASLVMAPRTVLGALGQRS